MRSLPDYSAQRARFLAAVARLDGHVTHYPHPLSGPKGEALSTDVAVIGDPAADNLLLIVSGTHGVEGYYGSDSQIAWLDGLRRCDIARRCGAGDGASDQSVGHGPPAPGE